jgi:hypothetical protein
MYILTNFNDYLSFDIFYEQRKTIFMISLLKSCDKQRTSKYIPITFLCAIAKVFGKACGDAEGILIHMELGTGQYYVL